MFRPHLLANVLEDHSGHRAADWAHGSLSQLLSPSAAVPWIVEVDPLVIASSTGGARRDGGLEIAGKEWMPSWRGRSDGSDGRGKKEMLSLLVFGGEAAVWAMKMAKL